MPVQKKLLTPIQLKTNLLKLAKVLDTSGNLSSAAYYRSIDILKGAFIENHLGGVLIDMKMHLIM